MAINYLDLPIGRKYPYEVDCVVEIGKDTNLKYEYDERLHNTITLEVNGLTSTYALSKAIDGQFVGFYSGCQGTEFANLTIS